MTNEERDAEIQALTTLRDRNAATSIELAELGHSLAADEFGLVALVQHADICRLENGRTL